jgi:hypothetical protein
MSASRKITAVQFVEWMHKHRYAKYWGSDKPNCEKWYVVNTMPDRKYYTLEELYDIFEREQKETEQQSNCNLPHVMPSLPDFWFYEFNNRYPDEVKDILNKLDGNDR